MKAIVNFIIRDVNYQRLFNFGINTYCSNLVQLSKKCLQNHCSSTFQPRLERQWFRTFILKTRPNWKYLPRFSHLYDFKEFNIHLWWIETLIIKFPPGTSIWINQPAHNVWCTLFRSRSTYGSISRYTYYEIACIRRYICDFKFPSKTVEFF